MAQAQEEQVAVTFSTRLQGAMALPKNQPPVRFPVSASRAQLSQYLVAALRLEPTTPPTTFEILTADGTFLRKDLASITTKSAAETGIELEFVPV